VLGMEVEG